MDPDFDEHVGDLLDTLFGLWPEILIMPLSSFLLQMEIV
jgi:hypothetical protein